MAIFVTVKLRAEESHRWTLRDSGTKQALNAVTGNGTLFVAVGKSGTILTSPDAVTWTPQASPTKLDLNGVAWFHDEFVAVGNSGLILVSADGVKWTTEIARVAANLHGVAASTSLLVAVGDGGTILLSANGVSWAVPAPPVFSPRGNRPSVPASGARRGSLATPRPPDLYHVEHTPHEFIIFSGRELITSAEGLIWSTTSVIAGSSDPFASGGGANAPGSKESSLPAPFARVGPEAETPEPTQSAASASLRSGRTGGRIGGGQRGRGRVPSIALNSAAQKDDLMILVGDAGQIWASAQAGPWSRMDNPFKNLKTEKLNDLGWSGRHLVVVGNNGSIMTSVDGAHWQNPPSQTKENLVALTSQSGLWVAVGANGTIVTHDDLPVIATPTISPDGGFFKTRPTVTLASATPGVTFRYTLNGDEPTEQSSACDQTFLLPQAGSFRVRAFEDGMDPSLECSADFQLPVVPKIVVSPTSVRVPFPASNAVTLGARFVVKSTGAVPAATNFRWEIKPAGSDKWADFKNPNLDDGGDEIPHAVYHFHPDLLHPDQWVPGVTSTDKPDHKIQSSALNVKYDPALSGSYFRCVVSNDAGEVFSGEAELTVFSAIPAAIGKQPESASVPVGQTATFTVEVKGEPEPAFQWILYRKHLTLDDVLAKKSPGELLQDNTIYSGTHTGVLTVKSTKLSMDGDQFVCTLTNGYLADGYSILKPPLPALYADKVALQVFIPPSLIAKQPASVSVLPGSVVKFVVTVPVDVWPKFQWQSLSPRNGGWQPLKNGPLYAGVNEGTLTVEDASLPLSGYKFRCVLDDGHGGNPEYTAAVVLTVKK